MRNIVTLAKPGSEANSAVISSFILGIELMLLRGLRILKVRNAFRLLLDSIPGTRSGILIATTKKSSQFQPSLRYAFLCTTNPILITLIQNSIKNTHVKPLSMSLRTLLRSDT